MSAALSGLQLGLASVSALSATAYGTALLTRPPSALRTITKALVIGSLALVAAMQGHGWLLAVGLALSALGDAFLAGDPKRWLPLGMASFLLAHAAYVVLFAHTGGGLAMLQFQPVRLAGAVIVVLVAASLLRALWSSLGSMKAPVSVYVVAIALMAVMSLTLPPARWTAMAGAAAFMASDAILAVRLFRQPEQRNLPADLAVWWLYVAAQGLIVWAFV